MVVFMEVEYHSEKWKSFRVKDNCYIFVALISSILEILEIHFLFILLLFHFIINIFDTWKLIYQIYVNIQQNWEVKFSLLDLMIRKIGVFFGRIQYLYILFS